MTYQITKSMFHKSCRLIHKIFNIVVVEYVHYIIDLQESKEGITSRPGEIMLLHPEDLM